jgi:hypothetical protein
VLEYGSELPNKGARGRRKNKPKKTTSGNMNRFEEENSIRFYVLVKYSLQQNLRRFHFPGILANTEHRRIPFSRLRDDICYGGTDTDLPVYVMQRKRYSSSYHNA